MHDLWRRARPTVAVLAFFLVLGVALTYPFAFHLADHLRDNGDSYEFAWEMGFGAYQLTHHPLQIFDGNIFYPYPLSVAYSESTVTNLLLGAPIVWLTGNPVLALNVWIFLSYALGALGMYLLVIQRTGSRPAALVAGVLYGFAPFRDDHLAQISHVSMEWAPFALWCFDRYLASGRYRWAGGFALFLVLQVLASFTHTFVLGLGIAIYVMAGLTQARRLCLRPRWILPFAGSCALAGLVVLPFLLPYFWLEHNFGLKRTLEDTIYYSAWPANFLSATPSLRVVLIKPLVSWLAAARPDLPIDAPERRLYLGVLPVVLGAIGIIRVRPARTAAPLAMVIAGIVLSFGPVFHPTRDVAWTLPFPLPYALLFKYLPGFDSMRVPSRFVALSVFGLAILAGDGLAALVSRPSWPRLRSAPRSALGLAAGCLALACAEGLYNFPLTPVPVGAAVPPVYRWLGAQPVPSPVVELPIDDDAFHQSPRSYLSTYDHQPLVNGFRSFVPPGYVELAREIGAFPAASAVATLQQLGVRYVVVHQAELPRRLTVPDSTPGVQPVARFGSDEVFAIGGQSGPVDVVLDASEPSCLPRNGALESLAVELSPRDQRPALVLAHDSGDLAFNLDWRTSSGPEFHETARVGVPAEVLVPPVKLSVPYHAPPRPGVYELTVSLVDGGGLRGSTALPNVPVGTLPALPSDVDGRPRLLRGVLPTTYTTARDGLPYRLVWQLPTAPVRPVVVFVNAYDDAGHYWSYSGGAEESFSRPADCGGNLLLDASKLALNPATPPGHYQIEAGLLDPTTRKRVPFVGPTGEKVLQVLLGSFWVRPANVYPPGALPAPDASQTYEFGHAIALEGWTLDGETDGALRLSLRWRAERPVATNYTVFVHLSDPATGKVVAQFDGQPDRGVYPTSAWAPGDTLIDQYDVPLPPSLPPGHYRLDVGLYYLKTLQRLPVDAPAGSAPADVVTLTSVTR